MKLLYVSYCTPHEKALDAGSQTLHYYINRLSSEDNIEVKVVSICDRKDADYIRNNNYEVIPVFRPEGVRKNIGRIISINSKFNPFHKYCNLITSYLAYLVLLKIKELKKTGYTPDVIILEWTQIVLLITEIKRLYPDCQYIGSEVDVTFQGFWRKCSLENNALKKIIKKLRYYNCKKREVSALIECDHIFTQSDKDLRLMEKSCYRLKDKISIQQPYYHRSKLKRGDINNDIVFFGAMGRIENKTAVIWFVKNVMPLLEDLPCRFVIIGGGVTKDIKSLESERVVVKGYVESIDEDFAHARCFVAPLQLGAGIKVKVIEAMYTEIPVLTNKIGIEGIAARKDSEYLHCETKEEYEKAIRRIFSSSEPVVNGKQAIIRQFSLDESYKRYKNEIIKCYGEIENDNN